MVRLSLGVYNTQEDSDARATGSSEATLAGFTPESPAATIPPPGTTTPSTNTCRRAIPSCVIIPADHGSLSPPSTHRPDAAGPERLPASCDRRWLAARRRRGWSGVLRSLRQRQAHSREGLLALRGLRLQERLQRLVNAGLCASVSSSSSPLRALDDPAIPAEIKPSCLRAATGTTYRGVVPCWNNSSGSLEARR